MVCVQHAFRNVFHSEDQENHVLCALSFIHTSTLFLNKVECDFTECLYLKPLFTDNGT